MTNYDVQIVTGTSQKGNEYKALQIIVHSDKGVYKSPLIFQNQLTPAERPDFFNENTPGIAEVYNNAF